MTLGEKQRKFVLLVSRLIAWAYEVGYELSFGEAERTPKQAEWNAAAGVGTLNSLHVKRLAIDLNLFIDGEYQTDSAAYAPLGRYWKMLDPDARWGGDFKKADGNHFSLEHEGVK